MGKLHAIELDIGVPQRHESGGPERDNEDQNSKFLANGGEANETLSIEDQAITTVNSQFIERPNPLEESRKPGSRELSGVPDV
jgi:hypothetical protein